MSKCDHCGKSNPADIHTCTPLALRLADALYSNDPQGLLSQAAAELRRLHAVNEELLGVLTMVGGVNAAEFLSLQPAIRESIAKATGEQV